MEIAELYKIFCEHPVITTDTRDCPEGSIFFALKGTSFNGNQFAQKALELGCSYAVVDEEVTCDQLQDRIIRVDDVLKTLQQLACYHREQLGTMIVGVTGTNGKTTTKELIAAVLSEKYNILYTLGNFNNHIGVPKTLLRLTSEHEMAVIEMGANHPGEIKTLVDIVHPDCGIITNVGRAHLGGFGSFEGVKATKGELYDFIQTATKTAPQPPKGESFRMLSSVDSVPEHTVFINNDSDDLLEMAALRNLNLIKYGTKDANDLKVRGEVIECAPFLTFQWKNNQQSAIINQQSATMHRVETKLIGDYNIYNMLAAATIGLTFGVSEEQICHALTNYTPSNNRSQLTVTAHNKLVVDAYNANPTSMAAALNNFKAMAVDNKMCILGSMGELGEVSYDEHIKVINQLKDLFNVSANTQHPTPNTQQVWLVGDEFAKTNHPFRQFANVDDVKAAIAAEQPEGKYILIKGSNSQKLFQLPELL